MSIATPGTSTVRPTCVGGLYEVCIGVPDIAEALADLERYGCRAGRFGTLDATAARALYGVDSALRSVRLDHQHSDHGLVRLMQWDRPLNEGLGLDVNLRCHGSRWGVRLTASILNVANHALRAQQLGERVTSVEPVLAVVSDILGCPEARPFADPIVGVRETLVIQPRYRQVFFQRFGYESRHYGCIDPACLFQTSQYTHAGLMIANDDHQVLRFYDEVLGLKRWFDAERSYAQAAGSRQFFGLQEAETHWVVDFDDPRSGHSLEERRSGKLKVIRFARTSRLVDKLDRSRPGCLGFSLYTWRVNDIEGMWRRVAASGATGVTDVQADEFGTRSFSCTAPDGYAWTLLQA